MRDHPSSQGSSVPLASSVRTRTGPGDGTGALRDAVRSLHEAQLLRAAVGPTFGQDVADGLARAEARATLALLDHRPCDAREFAAKAATLRSHATRTSAGGALVELIGDVLDRDAALLARGRARPSASR